jgi:hypothetical protein
LAPELGLLQEPHDGAGSTQQLDEELAELVAFCRFSDEDDGC